MPPFYMGSPSALGSAFAPQTGGGPTATPQPSGTYGTPPPQQTPGPSTSLNPQPLGPNQISAQDIRPTGPSGGFDPQYLSNLATAIGGLFSRPSGSSLNFNPLGNLQDVPGPQQGQQLGLPGTMLQNALNGGGFSWPPATQTTPTAAKAPVVQNGTNGQRVGGGLNGL